MDEGVVALIRFIATNSLLLAKINVTSHHWQHQLMQPIIVTWNQPHRVYYLESFIITHVMGYYLALLKNSQTNTSLFFHT
jgi:hypothetical protein